MHISDIDNNRIAILAPSIANQIAAGEVVTRPASVLKELVENSIDAGASKIQIELLNGGLSSLRVTDNGIGIPKEDLALSLARHATSKIKNITDLEQIQSLGFRGEALASIASVSKLRIISKTHTQAQAYQCRVQGLYLEPEILSASHENGTTVEVNELFYNVPVRRKFLKSVKTEFEYMDDIIKKMALSHYDIHFILIHNQKKLRDYPAALNESACFARVKKIAGSAFIEGSYSIDCEQNGLRLWGYVGGIQSATRHPHCQYFYVNQRSVRDKVISHAIKTGFQDSGLALDLKGLYPSYVLYLALDPTEVDVNVHPTKHEVRFLHARLIHDFISQTLIKVLDSSVIQEALEPFTGCRSQATASRDEDGGYDQATASREEDGYRAGQALASRYTGDVRRIGDDFIDASLKEDSHAHLPSPDLYAYSSQLDPHAYLPRLDRGIQPESDSSTRYRQQATKTRHWGACLDYYILTAQDNNLIVINMKRVRGRTKVENIEKVKKNDSALDDAQNSVSLSKPLLSKPLLFPIIFEDNVFSQEDIALLKNAGFQFAQNIKQESMITHLPPKEEDLQDCYIKIKADKMASVLDSLFESVVA